MKLPAKVFVLRVTLCLFSIILFWLLGTVGEALINLLMCQTIGENRRHLPALTVFLLGNFSVNEGHFLLSLTPLMVFMVGLASSFFNPRLRKLYWYFFVGVWLIAVAYFLVLGLAVLVPFSYMAIGLVDSPVPKVVWPINIALALSLLACCIITRLRPRKREKSTGIRSRILAVQRNLGNLGSPDQTSQ